MQSPYIASGVGLPVGYTAGGASSLGMMGNVTGGLGLVNQQGSWVISPAQSDQTQGSMPTMLPGGVQRQSINQMQSQQMQQAQMQSYYQRMATLNRFAALERLAAFNQVRQ